MSGGDTVHLYMGDDEFAVVEAARQLVNKLVPESERAFGLEEIDGRTDKGQDAETCVRRCMEAFMTRGFLTAQGKLVWWRDVTFLADGQVAQSDEVKARVKELVQLLRDAPPGGNRLLITSPKVDKRSALFKVCSDKYRVQEFFVPAKSNEAEKYVRVTVREALGDRKLRASPAVVELFLSKVGSDTRQVVNEIEKLALYVHGRQEITEDDVDAIVSASMESALWDIQDAVGKRQLSRALKILHNLLGHRENPIAIVTVIVNRLRELLVYREALDKGWLLLKPGYGGGKIGEWGDLAPESEEVLTIALKRAPRSLHPYRVGLLAQQARMFSPAMLRRNQRLALAAHESLVSSGVPEGTILELMLTKMMVPPPEQGSRGTRNLSQQGGA